MGDDRDVVVLDVRSASEHDDARLGAAVHVPLHLLPDRVDDLPAGRLWVHCTSGFRAATAASLLVAHGRDVVHVDDDFDAAAGAGLPVQHARRGR
jgi:rhodanese-related sulfurtransferase